MLISCADLIRLRAIPKGFPNVVIEECRAATEDWRKTLMEEFQDVLSDELSPKPMKTETPMHISLKKGVTPKKVTSAGHVPLRYEKEAAKRVKELIKKG